MKDDISYIKIDLTFPVYVPLNEFNALIRISTLYTIFLYNATIR
jgi:hypothetical protein